MNRKTIGVILLILSILLTVWGGYLAYNSYQLTGNAITTLFVSFLLLASAWLILRRFVSMGIILIRIVCVLVLLVIFISFLFPEPDISNLTILIIWAICLVHGFLYRPANKRLTGFLCIAAGIITILLYSFSTFYLPQELDILGLITGLFATGFLALGLYYLFYIPKISFSGRKPTFLYFVMTLTGFIGILGVILTAINEHGFILAPLGYVLLLLFAEWLLYRYRYMRLLLIWVLTLGGPILFTGAVSFINENVHSSQMDIIQYILFAILLLFLVILAGICSPIGMMGVYRIPSYRDFKKYLFPSKIKFNPEHVNPNKTNSAGFTLIELLIVIAIVAIVSGGIIRLFTLAHLGVKHLELQNQAVFLAESELDRLRTQSLTRLTMKDSISISDSLKEELKALPEGIGKINISNYKNTSLKEIQMVIQWQEGTHPYSVQLTTLLGERRI